MNKIKFLRCKNSLGIELVQASGGELKINLVQLTRKNNEINITLQNQELASFDEIKTLVKPGIPVNLAISGRGILNKKIEDSGNKSEAIIVGELLPNAKAKDFYVQIVPGENGNSYVSIIRVEVLKGYIEQIRECGLEVYDITLSNHFLFHLNSVIPFQNDFLIGDEFFSVKNNVIVNVSKTSDINSDSDILIGDEKIPGKQIRAFSAAFNYFIPHNEGVTISREFDYLRDEHTYRALYTKLGLGLLVFFFVLLTVNYIVFTGSGYKKTLLQGKFEQYNSLILRSDSLSSELERKSRLMAESGFLYTRSHAFMADKLVYLKPENILLESLFLQPHSNESEDEEKYIFEQKIVEIKGETEHSEYINIWISSIDKEEWVDDVELLEYSQDNRKGVGVFILRVKLK